ncbi:hypothetical protein BKA64DRAFT_767383 [Cadophora sp. MPI-SDFR-AT-0126]|nr:hypothetical protein BKA64DRAFT_767383 [Leotiomycetes sp. MPI-SDFR-AT-0126]
MYLKLSSLVPAVLLATSVAASGATIYGSPPKCHTKAIKLNTTVASWKGDAFGLQVPPSGRRSFCHQSFRATLSRGGCHHPRARTLVEDAKNVLSTTVTAKPRFDKLLIASPVVLQILQIPKDDRAAAKDLKQAVTEKVPAEFQEVATSITAPKDPAFAAAIKKYSTLGF